MYQPKKRSAGKLKTDITTKDLYKSYLKNLKPVESITGGMTLGSYNISEKTYSNILKDLNLMIVQAIILENFEFKLPYGLGMLSMVQKAIKYKLDDNGELLTKYLSVDYKATKDLWSKDNEARIKKNLVFHTNDHTNGNRVSYRWSKKNCKVAGLQVYFFVPCRKVKRAPAEYLKNSDYKLTFFEKPLLKGQTRQT